MLLKQTGFTAGWSSSVARRAHNPKVGGSNPSPATKIETRTTDLVVRVFFCLLVECLKSLPGKYQGFPLCFFTRISTKPVKVTFLFGLDSD